MVRRLKHNNISDDINRNKHRRSTIDTVILPIHTHLASVTGSHVRGRCHVFGPCRHCTSSTVSHQPAFGISVARLRSTLARLKTLNRSRRNRRGFSKHTNLQPETSIVVNSKGTRSVQAVTPSRPPPRHPTSNRQSRRFTPQTRPTDASCEDTRAREPASNSHNPIG